MNHIPWIPIVELAPGVFQEVIVSRTHEDGGVDNFSAVYDPNELCGSPQWASLGRSKWKGGWTILLCDVRVTDFWLAIPSEPPQHNAVNGGYTA